MVEISSCTAVNSDSSSGGYNLSASHRATSLKRVGSKSIPEAVTWLDHLTMELKTATAGGKTQYQLTMKYTPCQQKLASCTTWTINHSFDEYRALRKRLLKRMQHGHLCGAECKWLYKVVKHYFPRKSLFGNYWPKVVALRQQTLIRCLTTMQASLVNRGNQCCHVLVHDVAAELKRFVLKDMKNPDFNASPSISHLSLLSAATLHSTREADCELEGE